MTLLAIAESPRGPASRVYAVNVATGQARELFALQQEGRATVPGLVR
ncbi:hypothetical protein AB0L05_15560 [Nonomuraea pusilla]